MRHTQIHTAMLSALSCMVIVWLSGCGDPADASFPATEAQVAVPRPPEHVVIDDGELIGRRDGTSYLFGNIPYAKPPVDSLRWRRPEKNDPWSAPRDATKRGNRCHDHIWVDDPRTASEDCLNLDVWSPDPRAAARLPVMVYLRGGSRRGYRVDPADSRYKGVTLEDGRALSERGVVVVTLNTRRGLLGFFAHPDLSAEGSGGGNQGLHDQQLALRWVKQNISQFGGDAEQVTLWGQDAGAEDACLHAVAPTSRGLFQRIIAQSGACTGYQNTLDVAEACGAAS